jgi:hypothetical protein
VGSDFLRSNLADVSVATADWENRNYPDIDYLSREPWDPANLHIDRVGLNYDLVVRPEAGRALCLVCAGTSRVVVIPHVDFSRGVAVGGPFFIYRRRRYHR